jgi:hypothetical protein
MNGYKKKPTGIEIELINDFHDTAHTVLARHSGGSPYRLTQRQVRRLRETLCGVKGCTCGGYLGERGNQFVGIEPIYDDGKEDGALLWIKSPEQYCKEAK